MAEWMVRSSDVTMNQSEIEDSDHSSDEDYSPGSLVIDTAGFGEGVCVCVCVCVCVFRYQRS